MSDKESNSLLIIGAGYTGLELARQAVGAGWNVWGTTRKAASKAELEEAGAQAIYWDLAEDGAEALDVRATGRGAVVYTVPTIFETYEPAEPGKVARHVAPVLAVMARAEELGFERFVYVSSTSVYGDHDGDWVSEDDERRPTSPYGHMRKEIEDAVAGWEGELEGFVCQAVGIYGPGRTLDRWIARGSYKLIDGGTKPINRIHVDDLAGICLAIAEADFEEPKFFIATDGDPRPSYEVVDWMVEHLGIEPPETTTLEEYAAERGPNAAARMKNACRYKADRVKDTLGYTYRHPDVMQGYASIFDKA